MFLAPIPPYNVIISNIQSDQFTASWDSINVGRVHRFQVGYKWDTSFQIVIMYNNTLRKLNPNRSLTVTGLQNNSKYSIRVRTFEDGPPIVRSDWSPLLNVTTG